MRGCRERVVALNKDRRDAVVTHPVLLKLRSNVRQLSFQLTYASLGARPRLLELRSNVRQLRFQLTDTSLGAKARLLELPGSRLLGRNGFIELLGAPRS